MPNAIQINNTVSLDKDTGYGYRVHRHTTWTAGYGHCTHRQITWTDGQRIAKLDRHFRPVNYLSPANTDYTVCLCDGDILLSVGEGDTAHEAYRDAWHNLRLQKRLPEGVNAHEKSAEEVLAE